MEEALSEVPVSRKNPGKNAKYAVIGRDSAPKGIRRAEVMSMFRSMLYKVGGMRCYVRI